ncbi:MAG TPA: hypothetical protein VL020_06665 [Pseudomonadales bacterium]|nr:hypothetical protein [Pseudomonadales bacterium]
MVRLVVLTIVLVLSGCAQHGLKTEEHEQAVSLLPVMINGELAALDHGESHPALINLYQKAESARQQQQWQLVFTYLDQARQIQPRTPTVLYRLAWASLQAGNNAQAEQFAQRALIYTEAGTEVEKRLYGLLAQSLSRQGRMMEAYSAEQKAQ